MEELSSIASLLQQRGKATNMAMAMTKQYCNKLEGAGPDMSATDILKLSDHVAASEMPEECKDQILGCLDTIALQDNSGQSATKLLLQPQACPHLNNYLTAAEWKSLQTQGLWAGVNVLVHRLRLLGIKSLKESLKKLAVGILVLMQVQGGKNPMPKYKIIYDLGLHFGQCFQASTVQPNAKVKSLLVYPERPALISSDFIALAYTVDEPPVDMHLPDLNYLVLNHIPVRSTSKLLKDEDSTQHRANGDKSTPDAVEEAVQLLYKRIHSKQLEPEPQHKVAHLRPKKLAKHLGPLPVTSGGSLGCRNCFLIVVMLFFACWTNSSVSYQSVMALPSLRSSSSSLAEPPEDVLCLPSQREQLALGDNAGTPAGLDLQQNQEQPVKTTVPGEEKQPDKQHKQSVEDMELEAFKKINGKALKLKRPAAAMEIVKDTAQKSAALSGTRATAKALPSRNKKVASLVLGCGKCRGTPTGCAACLDPGFNGQRYGSKAAYLKFQAEKKKKGKAMKQK